MGIAGGIGDFFGGVNKFVTQDNPLLDSMVAVDLIGSGLKWQWNEIDKPMYHMLKDDIINPATAVIGAGPMNIDPNDPKRPLALINPMHWRDNFQAARGEEKMVVNPDGTMEMKRQGVSLGQVFYEGLVRRNGLNAPDVVDDQGAPTTYDFMNPEHRAQVYDHGIGKYMSGTVDAVKVWYLDPTVFIGKGAMVARAAHVTKPIHGWRPEDLDAAAYAGRGPELMDELAAMSKPARAERLARMKAFRGNVAIQHVLAEANSADEMNYAMRLAYNKDPSALGLSNVRGEITAIEDKIAYLNDRRIPTIQAALDSSKMPHTAGFGPEVFQADLNAATSQLRNMRNEASILRSKEAAAGSVGNVVRYTATEKYALGQGWDIYQPTRYGLATRIAKSANMGRVHTIKPDRPGEATDGVRKMLDRVGHGFHTRYPGLVTGRGGAGGMSAEEKGVLLLDMQRAEGQGPLAVQASLQRAEQAALNWYARELDMDPEKVKKIFDAANDRRSKLLTATSGSPGGAFSAARDPVTGVRQDMIMLDHDAGVVTMMEPHPVSSSQLPDRLPMMDVDQLARALRMHREAIDDPSQWEKLLAGLNGATTGGAGIAEEMLDKLNRLWKPAQLMRVAWPLRVITDENFRIMATVGAMTHAGLVMNGLAHRAGQTRAAHLVREVPNIWRGPTASREIEGLLPGYADQLRHAGIVDRISILDGHVATLDTKIAEAGKKMTALADARTAERVHRIVPGNTRPGVSPRGNRYAATPGDAVPAGHAVETKRISDSAKILHTTEADADAGIAALRTLSGKQEFDTLSAMRMDALRRVATREGVADVAKARSREDLLSMLGTQRARAKGYGAIRHEPTAAAPLKLWQETDQLTPEDVRVLAVRLGVDLPPASRATMTVPELRTLLGADADPQLAKKLDIQLGRLLKSRGYEGMEHPGPAPDEGITAFHGSKSDFKTFDDTKIGSNSDTGRYGRAHYAYAERGPAEAYTREAFGAGKQTGTVKEIRLHLKNTFDWNTAEVSRGAARGILVDANAYWGEGFQRLFNAAEDAGRSVTMEEVRRLASMTLHGTDVADLPEFTAAFTKWAKGKGFDSVKYTEHGALGQLSQGHTAYAVFEGKNIKAPPTGPQAPAGVKMFGKTRDVGAPPVSPSLTALTDDALADVPSPEALIQAADRLTGLTRTRRAVAFDRQELTGRAGAIAPWDAAMWGEWNDAYKVATPPTKALRPHGATPAYSGMIPVQMANGIKLEVPDVFNGQQGQVTLSEVDGGMTFRHLAGLQDRTLNGLHLEAGETAVLHPVPPTESLGAERELYEKSYENAWVRDVNDQIGKNSLMQKILEGQSDEAIVGWLRNTNEGKRQFRIMESIYHDPGDRVAASRVMVEHYLPTPELRQAVLQGPVTYQHLLEAVPNAAMRPDVHGEALGLATGKDSPIGRRYNQMVGSMYKYLGSMPTNTLSRHPYAAAIYRNAIRKEYERYGVKAGEDGRTVVDDGVMIPHDEQIQMQNRARNEAIDRVKANLYDLTRETHLGHAMRFVAPFYNAWADALGTWSKIWLEDPSRLARLVQIWESPSKAGMVQTDANGKQYIVTSLPKSLHKWAGVTEVATPKYALHRDLIAQGHLWFLPGAGPSVAVPAAFWARKRPTDADLLKPLIPYGAGDSIADQLIPAHWRKLLTAQAKGEDTDYVLLVNRSINDVMTEHAEGKNDMTPDEMAHEAERRANAVSSLKVAAGFLSPFPLSFRNGYDFYIDQMKTIQNDWRKKYPETGRDEQNRTADEAFIDKFGQDYYAFTTSKAQSNTGGISPTEGGLRAFEKYKDLIQANPDLGSLIVGAEDDGEFSSAAYTYQRSTQIGGGDYRNQREVLDPRETMKRIQVGQGWDQFRQINTAIQAEIVARGKTSITQRGNEDLKALKELAVEKIVEKFPLWGEAFDTFTKGSADRTVAAIETMVDDPRFANRPGWKSMAQYLAARKALVAELDARDAMGGSAVLSAKSNGDLSDLWELIVAKLTEQDLKFADLHSRYLDNDNLTSRATVAN